MRATCLTWVQRRRHVLSLACFLLLAASPARAQSCADDPAAVAPIAPVSYNPKYLTYKGRTIALVGMSHEYLCHIPQPQRVGQYCALGSYATVLADLQTKKNTLIRLWTVFNHSPGREAYGTPFTNEQPFKYTNGKWDLNVVDNPDINLTNLNVAYYTNLESVVWEAFCRGIIVEVTLLDPWCGDWALGPFNAANTTDGKGFTAERIFMSFENLVAKSDSGQNLAARNAQKVAAAHVVRKLKRFPNVIFEVANEPDLTLPGITPAHTTDLQNMFVSQVIQPNDNPAPSNHLVMINGHQSGAFAWNVPGAKVGSAHYTSINDTRYGATELMRTPSLQAARANHAISFNEGKAIGGSGTDPLTADDIRSEAWEFAFNEGALFDGYSVNRSDGNTVTAVTHLGVLRKFLADPLNYVPGAYIWSLASMAQTSCNGTGNWCRNVPGWGIDAFPRCSGDAKVYWATFKSASQYALYLHHGVMVNRPPDNSNNPFLRYDARVCLSPTYELPNFQFQVSQTGCWLVSWINPKDGAVLSSAGGGDLTAGVWYSTSPPRFNHDIVLLVRLFRTGTCY